MAANNPAREYMTIILNTRAAAEYVGLSRVTMERLRITGEGPPYAKMGRSVRYRREDLDEWVASKMRSGTRDADA